MVCACLRLQGTAAGHPPPPHAAPPHQAASPSVVHRMLQTCVAYSGSAAEAGSQGGVCSGACPAAPPAAGAAPHVPPALPTAAAAASAERLASRAPLRSVLKRPASGAQQGDGYGAKRVHFSAEAAGTTGTAQRSGAPAGSTLQPAGLELWWQIVQVDGRLVAQPMPPDGQTRGAAEHASSQQAQQRRQAPPAQQHPARQTNSQCAQARGGSLLTGVPLNQRLRPVWEGEDEQTDEDEAHSRPAMRSARWPPAPAASQVQQQAPQQQVNRRHQTPQQAVHVQPPQQAVHVQQEREAPWHGLHPVFVREAERQHSKLTALVMKAEQRYSAAAVLGEGLVDTYLTLLPVSVAQVGSGLARGALLARTLSKHPVGQRACGPSCLLAPNTSRAVAAAAIKPDACMYISPSLHLDPALFVTQERFLCNLLKDGQYDAAAEAMAHALELAGRSWSGGRQRRPIMPVVGPCPSDLEEQPDEGQSLSKEESILRRGASLRRSLNV